MCAATHAGRPASLKEILLKGTLKEVERIVQNLKTEVHLITAGSHPNSLPIYGVMNTDMGCLKIVMAFAPNGTLHELFDVDPATPLADDIQLDYAIQLCHGFIYLHDKKVVHMDLKNVNALRPCCCRCTFGYPHMFVCMCIYVCVA